MSSIQIYGLVVPVHWLELAALLGVAFQFVHSAILHLAAVGGCDSDWTL